MNTQRVTLECPKVIHLLTLGNSKVTHQILHWPSDPEWHYLKKYVIFPPAPRHISMFVCMLLEIALNVCGKATLSMDLTLGNVKSASMVDSFFFAKGVPIVGTP